MFDRRAKNVEIFKDTMSLISESKMLADAVPSSIAGQVLYLEGADVKVPENPGKSCITVVSGKRSFEAAESYVKTGKKVCVLNFASATNPGGGVTRGSSAQEESLCRCSTLYPCLDVESLWQGFYLPHRKAGTPLYNDDCIYTPGVYVCKRDVAFPERTDENDWYSLDVLTCAAPNLRFTPGNDMNPFAGIEAVLIDDDELLELQLKRIDRIFSIAAANGAEVLILGAFGCGAFCNSPEVVANAFKIVQEKYASYFDVIEYAVYCSHENDNFITFNEVLSEMK